jgi:hypothetical protein
MERVEKILSKEELRLEQNLFMFLKQIDYQQSEMLEIAKHNLKISKESNDEYGIKGWKLEIKNIKNRLRFIDTQMLQFPIYIDSTYSDYLKIVKR